MIAKLKGTVDTIKPMELILDVQGVGYQISIPIPTYEFIKDKKEIAVFVYTHHKEDQLRLFGFHREIDKELFTILIGITGIGPAMAMSILSSITIDRLKEAVILENSNFLTRIPGIGKSKAEKLIFELKRKLKKLEELSADALPVNSNYRDAIDALMSLGFDENKSAKTVNDIMKGNPDVNVETIIKEALKQMSA